MLPGVSGLGAGIHIPGRGRSASRMGGSIPGIPEGRVRRFRRRRAEHDLAAFTEMVKEAHLGAWSAALGGEGAGSLDELVFETEEVEQKVLRGIAFARVVQVPGSESRRALAARPGETAVDGHLELALESEEQKDSGAVHIGHDVIAPFDPFSIEGAVELFPARLQGRAMDRVEEPDLRLVLAGLEEFLGVAEVVNGEPEAVFVGMGGRGLIEERDTPAAAGLEGEDVAGGGHVKEEDDGSFAACPGDKAARYGLGDASEPSLGEEPHGRGL